MVLLAVRDCNCYYDFILFYFIWGGGVHFFATNLK